MGTPYCSNCLYDLSASTESGRCPECGRPLVEVLARVTSAVLPRGMRSRRYRSSATVFGMPFVDVATGPRPDAGEMFGHARGFISIGDTATGVIALGGRALGVVSAGGLSVGVFSIGGMAVGVYARGGGALGIHSISRGNADPAAVAVFDALSFLWPPGIPVVLSAYLPMLMVVVGVAVIGLLLFALGQVFKEEPVSE